MTDVLIQFGKSAFVGRFTFDGDESFARGTPILIRTIRGIETGIVLNPSLAPFAKALGDAAGRIERRIEDGDRETIARTELLAQSVLVRANDTTKDSPVRFIDAEATFDGSTVILHVIPWAECDLQPLLDGLSQEFQARVTLLDLSRPTALPDAPDAVDAGCGKPNCGSESGGGCSTGGCGTGSCSRGAVKSAGELTDYFVNLRSQMEAESAKRVALA